ncbi:UNKNOWN [Stylonychia lemnae]|uniref:Uncharacterized protein n=1 Tax=Stylonychia lemnae TaxID=5949 RepID=A0A078AV31_STYLE|nr:UNKNOWN [Stylonychia lemnae]|eukprot:CDW85861.1 UNKNOWN [Stylonychia lemnae]
MKNLAIKKSQNKGNITEQKLRADVLVKSDKKTNINFQKVLNLDGDCRQPVHDTFNFNDLDLDINEDIKFADDFHRTPLIKPNKFSIKSLKGQVERVEDNFESKTTEAYITNEGEENLNDDEFQEFKPFKNTINFQNTQKLTRLQTAKSSIQLGYTTERFERKRVDLTNNNMAIEVGDCSESVDLELIQKQVPYDSGTIKPQIIRPILMQTPNKSAPKAYKRTGCKTPSTTLVQFKQCRQMFAQQTNKVLQNNMYQSCSTYSLIKTPNKENSSARRSTSRSNNRQDSILIYNQNVIDNPDNYYNDQTQDSQQKSRLNQFNIRNEEEKNRIRFQEELNEWHEKYSSLNISNYQDQVSVPFGTEGCEQPVQNTQLSHRRFASNSKERYYRDQFASNMNTLSAYKTADMDDKEYKTQTKQRQHFQEQSSSRIKLTYSDQKEDLEPYKSRFNSQRDSDTNFALRMQNYHNSQVF